MKKQRSNRLNWLAVSILLPAVGITQPPDTVRVTRHEFSLQQAVDYAKKNNVNVKNALLDVQYQEQVNREVTANAYPHINGNINLVYNPAVPKQLLPNFIKFNIYETLTNEGVVNGSGVPITMPNEIGFLEFPFGTRYTATGGISLSQILFDGQVFVGLQARKATILFQQKNVELTEEMIKTNIYKIYYQLLVSKTQVELLDANVLRFEKLLHDTREIHKAGFAEQLDVDKVSVALTNLQTEKLKLVNIISNGYYGLKLLIGMPVKDELVLTDTLSDEQIKENILENSTYTYENRKEFQYAQIGKELNEYNIRRYKLSQIPTVMLNGSYARNAQREKFDFARQGTWFKIASVSLNVSIPIFNGFYIKSKIQQARIDLQKTENRIADLKLQIDNEVAVAKNNYSSAVAAMDFQKRNMELAEKVYQQTKKKYEMGTGSQTEINTAQTDLKAAQTNYITALYDAIIARVDFLKATGKL